MFVNNDTGRECSVLTRGVEKEALKIHSGKDGVRKAQPEAVLG